MRDKNLPSLLLCPHAQALARTAPRLHEETPRRGQDAEGGIVERADFCRKEGCPCADDCPAGCYLLEDQPQDEGDFDIHSDDKHNDPRHGQAEGLNAWKRPL